MDLRESIETRASWVMATSCLLIIFVGTGAIYASVVALKPIAAELGGRSVPSLAYALAYFGTGFGGVGMSWWAERQGSAFRPALLGSLMVGSGAMLASQGGALQLCLCFGLMIGLFGNAGTFPPMMGTVTRWFDRNRGTALALVASGQQVAGAVWPPIFRWAIDAYGWRQTIFCYGLFAVCTMAPMTLALRGEPPAPLLKNSAADARPGDRVLGLAPNLVLGLFCIAIVCCCIAMAMPMSHLVAFCSDLGFAPARGAEMLSLLLMAAFLSRYLWGRMSDRIGGLETVLIGSAGQAAMLSAFLATDGLVGLYIVSAAFGLAFGGIIPSYALAVRQLFPPEGTAWRIATVLLFGLSGMAIGGWVGGAMYDWAASYTPAFLVGVGFNLLNLVIVGALVLRRLAPSRAAQPAQ